ncbi:MAG: hypothetical protein K2Y42_12615 [Hyphomicrobium sp.]|jgi:hypothetical protein|uniref:hypothetical protein n=1 Tax=Hyphomicrobium sp. TaxID=82 RepID=UPI0025C040C3|nr:hypothetical protein [Hyphomicrobium sp.]MBX9863581.1 hypothetical protein [Hyphomicrobium sp.]
MYKSIVSSVTQKPPPILFAIMDQLHAMADDASVVATANDVIALERVLAFVAIEIDHCAGAEPPHLGEQ